MPPLLFVAAILAGSASASPDPSPLFSHCNSRLTEIPHISPCPDGWLRVVR
jgi:hypothetical protein